VCLCVWKVEGTFHVHKPPVLLGYTYDSHSPQVEAPTEAATQNSAENTYLTLFVTIEPQLAAPEPFHDKVCTACCALLLSCIAVSSTSLCCIPQMFLQICLNWGCCISIKNFNLVNLRLILFNLQLPDTDVQPYVYLFLYIAFCSRLVHAYLQCLTLAVYKPVIEFHCIVICLTSDSCISSVNQLFHCLKHSVAFLWSFFYSVKKSQSQIFVFYSLVFFYAYMLVIM